MLVELALGADHPNGRGDLAGNQRIRGHRIIFIVFKCVSEAAIYLEALFYDFGLFVILEELIAALC